MRKRAIFSIITLVFAFSTQIWAENIHGIEFDIPEDWQLVDSSDEDFGSWTYLCDNQVIIIAVGGVTSEDPEIQALNNIYIFDCDSAFGEMDGYYLMSDQSKKSDEGFLTRTQDCVYESDGWHYSYLCGVNTGNAAISIVYISLATDPHSCIKDFFELAGDFIPGLGYTD